MRLSLELILNYKPDLKQQIHKISKLHYELDELYELERPECYSEVNHDKMLILDILII